MFTDKGKQIETKAERNFKQYITEKSAVLFKLHCIYRSLLVANSVSNKTRDEFVEHFQAINVILADPKTPVFCNYGRIVTKIKKYTYLSKERSNPRIT